MICRHLLNEESFDETKFDFFNDYKDTLQWLEGVGIEHKYYYKIGIITAALKKGFKRYLKRTFN